jgi:hypothetical protein
VKGPKNEPMDARIKTLIAAISELEDHYAELLSLDAPDKELVLVWAHIRELRQQLHKDNAGLSAAPYFYKRRPDSP